MSLEKLKEIDNYIVPHKKFKHAQIGVLESIELSQLTGAAECAALVGPAGSGKTKLCESIVRKFKPYTEISGNYESLIIPAFYTSIPSPVTIKGVAINMLKSLGASNPHKGNQLEIQHRLGELLKHSKTQVILLDELQHLLHQSSSNSNVKDWIKYLINEYKIPIVVVGTPECEALIDSESQLARRFVRRFHLNNFQSPLKSNEFAGYISGVFKQFEKVVGVPIELDLKDPKILLSLYAFTGGNPSDINQLFKKAIYHALTNKKPSVTYSSIKAAATYLTLAYSLCDEERLFKLSTEQLIEIITNHENK